MPFRNPKTAIQRATVKSLLDGTSVDHQHRNSGGARIRRILRTHVGVIEDLLQLVESSPHVRGKILKLLASRTNGVTYDDLEDTVPRSRGWLKQKTGDLRDAGILKTPGNPATVRPASWELMIVIKELVAFLFGSPTTPALIPSNNPTSSTKPSSQATLNSWSKTLRDNGG